MKEEFVSYAQAVALYNLDFDRDCGMAYFDRPWNHEHRLVHFTIAAKEQRDYDGTDVFPAPTQALAQKWLRDEKGIDIEILLRDAYRREYRVMVSWVERQIHKRLGITYNEKSYESALSAGLDAAIEIIKQTQC